MNEEIKKNEIRDEELENVSGGVNGGIEGACSGGCEFMEDDCIDNAISSSTPMN